MSMEISRVEFFCPDKKVGEVLRLLAGIALEIPKVTPVVNAMKKSNNLKEETRGNTVEMFGVWLKKNKLTEINADGAREFLRSIGKSPESKNYLFDKARSIGLLRKTGKGSGSIWKVK